MLSPFSKLPTSWTDLLMLCFVLGFWFLHGFSLVCFLFCFCFLSVFFCRHRDSNRTLYWSHLSSLLKSAIVMMDDVFALINRICQFAAVLQAWWTTWRELWGVGRKKKKSRLRMKVCEARQRGVELDWDWRSVKKGSGGWNLKMRLKVCEARQRGVELKDQV